MKPVKEILKDNLRPNIQQNIINQVVDTIRYLIWATIRLKVGDVIDSQVGRNINYQLRDDLRMDI